MAVLTCTRSIFGAALPFAAQKMYGMLGVHWAGGLLGFLALVLGMVPWVFWRWGGRIRKSREEPNMKSRKRRAINLVIFLSRSCQPFYCMLQEPRICVSLQFVRQGVI